MSFKASDAIPMISWADIHTMNELVRPDGREAGEGKGKVRPLEDLRFRHKRYMERTLLGYIKPSMYVVLSAISSRTFSWSKIIEPIPLTVLANGLKDKEEPDCHLTDEDGQFVFAGTGLNHSTLRKAAAWLAENRLIERFQVAGAERNTHVYMPVSARTMFYALVGTRSINPHEIPESIMARVRTTEATAMNDVEWQFVKRWLPDYPPEQAGRAA